MGILSWLAGPGGWIGDAVKSALTGPIVQGVVDGYKAKLAAGNTSEKLAADLAARELTVETRERELAVQQNIADEGRWWTAAPRAIACWSFAIFIAKCVVWDKVLGLGSTDPLTGSLDTWAGWLMALWFGGRSAEKVARILARR
jgi:hypothetical protein